MAVSQLCGAQDSINPCVCDSERLSDSAPQRLSEALQPQSWRGPVPWPRSCPLLPQKELSHVAVRAFLPSPPHEPE